MVETALGLLKLIDENTRLLEHLVGDPNSMSNRIEQSIRMFIEADHQRFFKFSKHRPCKGARQPRRKEYKGEVDEELDVMDSSIITIEDVLGPLQTRKIFHEEYFNVPDPDAVMTAVSEEEDPFEKRACKLCNTGKTLSTCECEACSAWRMLGDKLSMKHTIAWTNTLEVIENFCKRQRTMERQYAGSGAIPGSASSASHGETSKSGVGAIPTSHPGTPSFAAASHNEASKSEVGDIPTLESL